MTTNGVGRSSPLTRRAFLKVSGAAAGVAALAACSNEKSPSKGGAASGTINALFMQQAAYSTADIQGMTKAFQQANPGVKVTPTFVATRPSTTRSWRRRPRGPTTSSSWT